MSEELDLDTDRWDSGWDRTFLNLSDECSKIFGEIFGRLGCRLVAPLEPNTFDNASTKMEEVSIRVRIVAGAALCFLVAALPTFFFAGLFKAGAAMFRGLGYYFQKGGFTHIRGTAPEVAIQNGQASVMTWNIRGSGYDRGGVIHWSSRIDRIVASIKAENPDVIVLQEVYDTALIEALVEKLGDTYAHFYTHLGPNIWGSESGCVVITKCAVHHFSHTEFLNPHSSKINRGFSTLEIKASPEDKGPCARITGTQLTPDKDHKAQVERKNQVVEIIDALAERTLMLPTLLAGSLHVDRDDRTARWLARFFQHSHLAGPTYSPALVNQWAPVPGQQEESNDFIDLVVRRDLDEGGTLPVVQRGVCLEESHTVSAFGEDHDTRIALSDHQGVFTKIGGLRSSYAEQAAEPPAPRFPDSVKTP